MDVNSSLKDEVAIVTGGNSGIGKAIASRLAFEGACVFIWGTNEETGQKTVEEITQVCQGAKISFMKVDVSNTLAVDEAIKNILNDCGHLDILVNNAGITKDQLLMKMTEDEWDLVLQVNLKSCFNTCRSVLRSMIKAKKGSIINISSVVGLQGNSGQTNYAASKAGMIGFSKSLAKEVASRKIRVNCVAPGFIKTKMSDVLSDKQKEMILSAVPMGRFGEAEEVADAVWFLASKQSLYITGQVISVDGGMGM